MRFYWVIFLLFLSHVSPGQPTKPADYGLQAFTMHDKALGDIHFYVSSKGIDRKKPVILALDGSGHFPLATFVQLRKSAFVFNSFDNDILALADQFHVVFISKPGTPFCDTITADRESMTPPEAARLLQPSAEYRLRSGLQWRADASSRVIDYVCKHLPVDRSKIIAYGYSEGAQVVPKLAVMNRRVTHCAAIAGSGLNQFYDFITAVRMKAAAGLITQHAAQQQVDSLFAQFAAIYAAPNDVDREWENNSYKRWASYCSDIPLDNLVKLNIPVFIAACSADQNSPVYGLEYVRLEFLRLGKKNLAFHVYPTDHFFNETIQVNGQDTVIAHKQEMIRDFVKWTGN
jgi:dienelactone hydrolase